MNENDSAAFATGLISGDKNADDLAALDSEERAAVIDRLTETPDGRRWLRTSPVLDRDLADRLIALEDDFRGPRPDSSLDTVIEMAGLDLLVEHAPAIAAGAGAPALWSRLSGHPDHMHQAIRSIVESGAATAIDATATHLLLDPANPYDLPAGEQASIAIRILATRTDAGRGIAAEYLASNAPETLAQRLAELARDTVARVRGFAWLAAYRVNRETAWERATEILGDESVAVDIRRSALNAAGESLPTEQLTGLLSYFVVHPTEALALDAATLLHRHHRHPEIAIAAAGSPHDEVREIANRLMDPYRGSPAAGGSRPGDPLREDPLLKLMRQLEEEETEE